MAKMKMYAVDVQITQTITVYVDARRPGGAQDSIETDQGWQDATRYEDDSLPHRFDPKTMKVLKVREA